MRRCAAEPLESISVRRGIGGGHTQLVDKSCNTPHAIHTPTHLADTDEHQCQKALSPRKEPYQRHVAWQQVHGLVTTCNW